MSLRAPGLALAFFCVASVARPQAADAVLEVRGAAAGTEVTVRTPGYERRVRADPRGHALFPHLRPEAPAS